MKTSIAKEYRISIPRSISSKKKQTAQRSARISNLPIDILNKVHDKQNIINSIQFDPPHFSPSSVPVSICSSPQSSVQIIKEQESNEKPTFINYIQQIPKMNSNTIIINNIPKDINEVISEIISTRPPADPLPMQDVTYVCPFSMVPITCPGRSFRCQHRQCFDLREFLLLNFEENSKCPICGIELSFADLRFDPFYFKSFNTQQNFNKKMPEHHEINCDVQQNAGNLDSWDDFNSAQLYDF